MSPLSVQQSCVLSHALINTIFVAGPAILCVCSVLSMNSSNLKT